MKAAFDRFFFRGRHARETLLSVIKRIESLERRLYSVEAKLSGLRLEKTVDEESTSVQKCRQDLSAAIGEVIAALETERGFIRGHDTRIAGLELAHRGGSHDDLWAELDEIRRLIRSIRGHSPALEPADQKSQ